VVGAPLTASIAQSPANPLCGVTPTLTVTASGGNGAAAPAPGARYYIRDTDPWGTTNNTTAMNAVFGAGNYITSTFAAATPATVFVPSTQFVFLEGSDANWSTFNTYITNNLTTIQNWVFNGGRLFMNSGAQGGAVTNWGFGGVQHTYPSMQGTATGIVPAHPIFNGPFNPSGVGPYSGSSYAHATISGGGITPLVTNAGLTIFGEKQWGGGLAFFGGATSPNYHTPAPNAQNLWQNIISYVATSPQMQPYTYSWAPGGATTVAITAPSSGIYTVTVTSPVGCPSTSTSIGVTINPAVTVAASGNPTTVCPGSSSLLTATGADTYVWNPGGLTGSSVSVTPAVTTTYTVVGTSTATGCTNSATVTITASPGPVFGATTATPSLLCPNDPTTLTSSASVTVGAPGPGPYTVTTIPYAPLAPVGPTSAGPSGDDTYTSGYPIGFTFPFFGVNKTTFGISTNGYMSFDPAAGAGCCSGQVLPNAGIPNDLIALGWADLNTGGGGTIDYFSLTSPNRLVVRFNGVAQYSVGLPNQTNGQIVLYQDGTIDMHITQMSLNNTVTLGVENASGTVANAIPGYNGAGAPPVINNQSWRFSQFTTTPVTNFLWSNAVAGAIATPAAQTTTANPPAAYTYTVTATSANGCTATSTVAVTMKPSITGTATATPAAVCIGGSTTLSGNVPLICGGTDNGFAGQYAPANWTLALINSAGTVNAGGAPANVIISTGSNISGNPGWTTYRKTIPCAGNVTFNWATSVSTNNLAFLGQPQYRINSGSWINMPGFNTGGASMGQNGTASIPVASGDTITLATYTLTNDAADAFTLTISNFSAPAQPISGFVEFWDAAIGGTNLGPNPTVTPASVGTATYYAQFNTSSPMGCTNPVRTPVNVTVNGLPVVSGSASPATICPGSSSVLSGSGASTYTWNPGSLANPATVSPALTATYTVTGTDVNGCTNTASTTVTVNPLPVMSTPSATPTAICLGGTSTLAYSLPCGTISGFAAAFAPANWTLTQSNSNGTVNTAGAPGNIVLTSSDGLSGAGTSDYSIAVSCSGNVTFNWSYTTIDGAQYDYPRYRINGNAPVTFPGYNTAGGTAQSGSASIPVNAGDVIGLQSYSTDNAFGACTITISSFSAPAPSQTINWAGPATIANPGNATTSVTPGAAGTLTYTVTVTDVNGCTNTTTTNLNVNGLPVVTASSTPSPATVCAGGSVTLTGGGATSYTWTDGTNTPANNVAFVPAASSTYTVTGIDGNGCSNTASLPVTVNALPVVTASSTPSPATVCAGGSVTLNGGGASTYTWTDGSNTQTNGVAFVPAASSTYTVTGTNGNGCTATATLPVTVNALPTLTTTSTPSPATVCLGGSVTLSASGATTYAWTDGSNTPANNVAFSPIGTSTYTVTGTDGSGCTATATVPVTVNPLPGVTAAVSATPICLGASTTFTGGGAATYTWTNGVNTPTDAIPFAPPAAGTSTYTVTGTDGNGCTATSTVSLVVNGSGSFNPPVTVSSSCPGALGSSVLVSSTGTVGAVTYSINPNYPAQPVGGIFNGMIGSAAYTITLSDANGCTASTTLNAPANATNGELANASLANATSQAGNTCQGQNQPDGASMSYYGATCDDLIVKVDDGTGGNVLGNVNACVTVLPGVQTYNGQPYVRRWYDITPQNQGPATLTFYFTHEDITGFNANAGSYPQIPGVPVTPSNGNTISFLCSQVPQGFLPGAPGANTTLHNVTATWNASTNRWEATISVASFSGFYFHTGSLPLPVALTKFDGRKLNSSNLLEWTTASEQNNAYFNLQYSTNGSDFTTIAKVDSKAPNGNSAVSINYSFEHLTPSLGHNYYRLQQVDLDNHSTINAKVVDLIWGTNGSTVSIYPNPTQDVLNIDLYTSKVQNTTVKVLDMSGRIVKQIQARSEVGMNKLSISLGEVAGGIYTVQIFENDQLTHVDKVRKADK